MSDKTPVADEALIEWLEATFPDTLKGITDLESLWFRQGQQHIISNLKTLRAKSLKAPRYLPTPE